MDAIVSLGVMIGLFIVLVRLTHWVSPEIGRLITSIGRMCWRTGTNLVWRQPARHIGAGKTMWVLFVVFTVILTIAAIAGGDPRGLPAVAVLWAIVVASWWVMRWLAERRYGPRDLPTRRRR